VKHKIKIVLLTLGIFQLTAVFGQKTELDTVFVKRTIGENEFEIDTLYIPGGRSTTQVLAGTMFLPSSDKMNGLLNNGLSPISLEIIQECDNTTDPRTFKEYPKFISTSRVGNTLTIDVSIIANCCHNFLGEAEVVGNDTLNLVYTSYGGFCSCECCFTLRYKFDTSMEDMYQVLNYVTINGSKTVGQIVKQDLATKQHIDKIKTVFENYVKYQESTDSQDDKDLMTKSLKSITCVTNNDELELLINVWMYYDPTDYPDIPEIYRILKGSKPHSIEAVKNRIDNKKEWETGDTAPYTDLKVLLKRLENEQKNAP
jgi:hypothetical protein